MRRIKKILAAVLLLALAMSLAGCGESSGAKYSRAEKLLGEEKYDEAVKLLEELGSQELSQLWEEVRRRG